MTDAATGAVTRRWPRSVGAVFALLVVVPALALGWQTQGGGSPDAPAGTVDGADLLRAIELPRAAQDARAAGIAEEDLRGTLELLQARGISASDARDVLSAYLRLGLSARGEALAPQVAERLEAGVRGPALSDALRASSTTLAPPAAQAAPAQRQVPRDTAGERRPLSDTRQLPPEDAP